MIGQKCSVPHQHSWGSSSYHNALICGVEEIIPNDDDDDADTPDFLLRVLFTNPTHKEMLPCTYYLEGECRFDDEHCHYSHGALVSVDDLREYAAPNFERLARNCVVLVKQADGLWYRGKVLCVNFMENICRVRLDGNQHKEKEKDYTFENLLPILSGTFSLIPFDIYYNYL